MENLSDQVQQLTALNIRLRKEKGATLTLARSLLKMMIVKYYNYYTGLSSWNLLSKLLTLYLTQSSERPEAFQQLLITLMRLQLGLSGRDIAFRFGIIIIHPSESFSFFVEVLYSNSWSCGNNATSFSKALAN